MITYTTESDCLPLEAFHIQNPMTKVQLYYKNSYSVTIHHPAPMQPMVINVVTMPAPTLLAVVTIQGALGLSAAAPLPAAGSPLLVPPVLFVVGGSTFATRFP